MTDCTVIGSVLDMTVVWLGKVELTMEPVVVVVPVCERGRRRD